jgi:hypothetical protein
MIAAVQARPRPRSAGDDASYISVFILSGGIVLYKRALRRTVTRLAKASRTQPLMIMVSTFRHPHLFCRVDSIGLREMKWLSLAQAVILASKRQDAKWF